MKAMRGDYLKLYGENNAGMSDDDFYGRSPAVGVDIAAAQRAAVRAIRHATEMVVFGETRRGALKIRRAAIMLAITVGNQSIAENYLAAQALVREPQDRESEAAAARDAAELKAGVNRLYPHPGLKDALAGIDAELAATA